MEVGYRVAFAVLRAPLSACMARAQGREGEPPVDADVIERLWRNFADLGELEPNALDLGTEPPEEVADKLARRLAAGLLTL